MLKKWKSLWSRLFGGRRRTVREEKVLGYVVHQLNHGARLQDLVHDEYVRRMATEDEIRRILADPRVVEGARGRMREDLDLQGTPSHRSPAGEGKSDETKTGRGVPLP